MLPTAVVQTLFDAYLSQDRARAEELIGEELRFTSPQDDGIDRAAYFERCFPTADRLIDQTILRLVGDDHDRVFLLYEYELKSGERHRNAEYITVRDSRVTEIQVFFGGRVPSA